MSDGSELGDRGSARDGAANAVRSRSEPGRVLDEVRRVGGGHAVISVPDEPRFWGANLTRGKHLATFGNFPGHIHHFGRRSLERLLAQHYAETDVVSSFPWLVADVRW